MTTDIEPEAFYDGTSSEPVLMWAYEGYTPSPNDVVLYKGDDHSAIRNAVLKQCATMLAQRAKGWRSRGSTILSGKLVADELQHFADTLLALKS